MSATKSLTVKLRVTVPVGVRRAISRKLGRGLELATQSQARREIESAIQQRFQEVLGA